MHNGRDANSIRFSQGLQPGSDVDTDPKLNFVVWTIVAVLDGQSSLDRFDSAGEFD